MDSQAFESTYQQMSDGELAKVLRDRRDLVPEARKALDLEIQNRHLDPSQLRKLRPEYPHNPHSPSLAETKLKGKKLRWYWLLADIVLAAGLALLLDHFGVEQLFWPIVITISVPAFTIWGHLELVKRLWFWGAITIVVAAHMLLFYFAAWPWGTRWVPAVTINGLVSLDLIAIFVLISRIEKLLGENQNTALKARSSG